MQVLGRNMQDIARVFTIPCSNHAARLHWVGDDAMVIKSELDDMRGAWERGIGGAFVSDFHIQAKIAVNARRDHRRIGRQRLFRRGDRLQGTISDIHEIGGIQRLGVSFRDNEGHRLSRVADNTLGQQRLRQEGEWLTSVGLASVWIGRGAWAQRQQAIGLDISRGHYIEHTHAVPRPGNIDRLYPRVGVRRSHEHRVTDAIEHQIVEIGALSGEERSVFTALRRIPDCRALFGHFTHHSISPPSYLRNRPDISRVSVSMTPRSPATLSATGIPVPPVRVSVATEPGCITTAVIPRGAKSWDTLFATMLSAALLHR
jgi:hypothetical protein